LPLALYQLAQVASRQDRPQAALGYLREALERGHRHEGTALGFATDPIFASLRERPEFVALVADARHRGGP
jgi:hypothetical protein